jgi:exonuclease III
MIELLFNNKKKQSTRIFVASIYAPQSGITMKDPQALPLFHQSLADLLRYSTSRKKKLPPHEKHYTVMGGDWNASIGTKNPEIDNGKVLGKYGITHANEAGGKLTDFMQENELRAPHTFFKTKKNRKPATFYDNLRERRPLTLDFFLTSQKLGNRVIDAKVYKPQGGPVSDHHAMRIKIRLSNKMRPNYANAKNRLLQSEPKQPHTFINWSKLNDADILMQYQETIDTILSIDETINHEDRVPRASPLQS